MLLKGLHAKENIYQQIFQIVFLISILLPIMANPVERKSSVYNDNAEEKIIQKDSFKDKVINDLKSKILQKLNLKEAPKFNSSFDWSSMTEQIRSAALRLGVPFDETTENSQPTSESMIISLTKVNHCIDNSTNNQHCYDLTIPNMDNKILVGANFIIQFLPLAFERTVEDNIIYNITINNLPETVYSFSVAQLKSNSLYIAYTNILKTLLGNQRMSHSTFSFTVSISGDEQTTKLERMIDIENIVIELEYQVLPTPVRKRRDAGNTCIPNTYFCCTQTLKVGIDELGWSQFIFAPTTFTINYCRGDCNSYLTFSSNHARALNFARGRGLGSNKDLRACCVPYSYSSLTIMYLNNENALEVSTFNDLIAATCGCM